MANTFHMSNARYFNYFFSIILGYNCVSVIFILFNQLLTLGNSSKLSISLLTVIFSGLIIGFLLTAKFKRFFQIHIKSIILLSVFWLGCFISTLFLELLQKIFSSIELVLISFIIIGPFVLFIILGCLIATLFINTINNPINYLTTFTLGLLLGVLITEIIILNIFGISWAIFLDCCLLLACVLIHMENFVYEIITSSAVIALIVIVFGVNIHINQHTIFNNKYRAINNESFITVAQSQSIAVSLIKKSDNVGYDKYPYMPLLKKIIYQDLNLSNKSVLVLGDGGYQLGNGDKNNIYFTYLTFTSNQLPSACTYLGILEKGDQVLSAEDNQISKLARPYNAIIANIFPNDFTIPTELLSYQYILKIRNALSVNGTAIFNIVARPTLSDLYSKRIDNTIRAVFPSCMEIPLVYGSQSTNIIYVCHKSNDDKDNSIYTANLGAATFNLFTNTIG